MAVERAEIQHLIEMIPPERLPMLGRIVRWIAREGGGRELIWDPNEVTLIGNIVAHGNNERFFAADEADRYLRHLSGNDETTP